MFESSKTYGLFTKYFDADIYYYTLSAKNWIYMLNIIGIAKVLEAVEISQRDPAPYKDLKRFLEQDFATIHNDTEL